MTPAAVNHSGNFPVSLFLQLRQSLEENPQVWFIVEMKQSHEVNLQIAAGPPPGRVGYPLHAVGNDQVIFVSITAAVFLAQRTANHEAGRRVLPGLTQRVVGGFFAADASRTEDEVVVDLKEKRDNEVLRRAESG